jgi:precorrin-6B methylase 2
MSATTPVSGSAEKWGLLWGARPRAWGENEEMQVPTYEEAIRQVGIAPGQRVLDIGCGTGVFLRLVATVARRRSASTPRRRCSRSPASACPRRTCQVPVLLPREATEAQEKRSICRQFLDGAAQESNLPSDGLRRLTGFEESVA